MSIHTLTDKGVTAELQEHECWTQKNNRDFLNENNQPTALIHDTAVQMARGINTVAVCSD